MTPPDETAIRLDERRKVLSEVFELVDDFSWVLPLYESKEVNLATDDAACSVTDQIAARIKKMLESAS